MESLIWRQNYLDWTIYQSSVFKKKNNKKQADEKKRGGGGGGAQNDPVYIGGRLNVKHVKIT